MNKIYTLLFYLTPFLLLSQKSKHPNLMLTAEGVAEMKANLTKAPLFVEVLELTQEEVDAELLQPMEVPVPKDMAGGYTHERHKRNWFILQKAGVLFQLTGDERYAVYVRDMLLAYAELYPTLDIHPTKRSYATGKIFWQCLNDANWLVYVSQAYDCVYDWMKTSDREILETQLFRPYADFLSIGNPQFFNRIHNHSTWGNAAVGMIGLVMKDEELIQRALYGLSDDELPADLRDDDNGRIKIAGQERAGFLAQMDLSFSPDGYFTEGPYYLRYAIYPFLLFSKSLANNRPDLNILAYRDSILQKAVYSLLYQADYQGRFFPINDAQKGMSWNARELITAVDLAYFHYGKDPMLLSVARQQNNVILDEAGFSVARAIAAGKAEAFVPASIAFSDGATGEEGGVGILRASTEKGELCALMKYSAQGMGHGHFDKLSYSLYDEKGEVLQDYGAARWVNIDQKGGGRYLPENNTWAKQSIAHNTLVVDETSHYEGKIQIGEKHHPDLYLFDANQENVKIISATSAHAYADRLLDRTLLLIKDDAFAEPLLIDVFRVQAEKTGQYDLPIWFQGHLLSTDFEYEASTTNRTLLGEGHGYQHLWLEAKGQSKTGNAQVSWFNEGKFYTHTTLVDDDDELLLVRLGANDPNFNLRTDPAFIIRKKEAENAIFISITEPHGDYNPVDEIPLSPYGTIATIELLYQDADYTIFSFSNQEGASWTIHLAHSNSATDQQHKLEAEDVNYSWTGSYQLTKN